MLQLLHKRAERQIVNLPAPEPRHTEKTQVFDTDGVIPLAELMARLPLPVVTAVADTLVATFQVPAPFTAVAENFMVF